VIDLGYFVVLMKLSVEKKELKTDLQRFVFCEKKNGIVAIKKRIFPAK